MLIHYLAQVEFLTTLQDLARWIGMPAAMMSIALYAIHRGWFVTGKAYDKMCREKEELWQELRNQQDRYVAILNRQAHAEAKARDVIAKMASALSSRA